MMRMLCRRGVLAVAALGWLAPRTGRAMEWRLAVLLAAPASAAAVAAAFLAEHGAGTELARGAAARFAPAAGMDGADLREWVGAAIRTDFANGEMVSVDGWLLSPTEVAACLLVAGRV